jgi:hypothetical protein
MHYACAGVIWKINRNELSQQIRALQCALRSMQLILFLAAASACVAQQSAEKSCQRGNASMSDYLSLYDRVQMDLREPQHWGSGFLMPVRDY